MPERFSDGSVLTVRAAWHRLRALARAPRALLLALVLGTVATTSACTEELTGGEGCPLLCPQQQQSFRDTIIEAIDFDTTLGPYPVLGLSNGALLASRGDTLETFVVVRFDALPDFFNPNGLPIVEEITAIDSTVLRFFVDTVGSRASGPFTIEVFNVDTTESDSSAAVVRSLFRPDRKLSEITLAGGTVADSLRIPLPDAFLLARIQERGRLRVGLRIASSANAQLRLGALVNGEPAPRLTFDPSSDTTYLPLDITPRTGFVGAELDDVLRLSYTVYTLTERGTPPQPAGTIAVGGWPSRRAYLRFLIPPSIIDSSTVVRADLLLTQVPAGGPDRSDTVTVQPFVGISTSEVSDPYVATALSLNGLAAGVDFRRLVPRDSGERAFTLVNLVRSWSVLNPDVTRFIALRFEGEGSLGNEIRFFSRSAPPALRPRLRITYMPRTEFGLP
jgi:hypothetical protein